MKSFGKLGIVILAVAVFVPLGSVAQAIPFTGFTYTESSIAGACGNIGTPMATPLTLNRILERTLVRLMKANKIVPLLKRLTPFGEVEHPYIKFHGLLVEV